MATNVSVGFTPRASSASLGGGFSSFATGAVDKANQLFDEERALGHQKRLKEFDAELAAGNMALELSEREKIALRKEERAKQATSVASAKRITGMAGLVRNRAMDAGAAFKIPVDDLAIQQIAKSLIDSGVSDKNAPGMLDKAVDAYVRQRVLEKYTDKNGKLLDLSGLPAEERQMVLALSQGQSPSQYIKHINKLSENSAGTQGKYTPDKEYMAVTGGRFLNRQAYGDWEQQLRKDTTVANRIKTGETWEGILRQALGSEVGADNVNKVLGYNRGSSSPAAGITPAKAPAQTATPMPPEAAKQADAISQAGPEAVADFYARDPKAMGALLTALQAAKDPRMEEFLRVLKPEWYN